LCGDFQPGFIRRQQLRDRSGVDSRECKGRLDVVIGPKVRLEIGANQPAQTLPAHAGDGDHHDAA
jgi:hypothetical protein